MRLKREDSTALVCSFCGKNDNEVAKLIAGDSGFICDDCVRVANSILAEEGIPIV